MAMVKNLNYLFNKDYYTDVWKETRHNSRVKACNNQIQDFDFSSASREVESITTFSDNANCQMHSFNLKTHYPGLLLGLGNPHPGLVFETDNQNTFKKNSEEIKLGFYFDYVTGLPVIPGSTVKGALRSVFRKCPAYIIELLDEILVDGKDKGSEMSEADISILEQSIFGEWCKGEDSKTVLPIQGRDVFFDAIISSSAEPIPNKQGNLLDFEYITSHRADDPSLQGLTEPNPVRLIKVRAGVSFQFNFILKDIKINGRMFTAKTKEKLFKAIIEEQGIGAKTNTGYGIMVAE